MLTGIEILLAKIKITQKSFSVLFMLCFIVLTFSVLYKSFCNGIEGRFTVFTFYKVFVLIVGFSLRLPQEYIVFDGF